MKHQLFLFFFLLNFSSLNAQVTKWDDTENKNWLPDFRQSQVLSTYDKTPQPVILYKTKSKTPQPLIVSLHSWSGDFEQGDSIALEVLERDWNYIHPHFRGPNNHPMSCGSEAGVQDIDDAIRYMVANANVDTNEIHIMGGSGGGYMTLVCYHKLKYPKIKSFQSWVGISDLVAWHYESLARTPRYSRDILKCTGDTLTFNETEAQRRSPLYMPFNPKRRKTPLLIAAGIHDGYQGSVPITHSINMYNKLIKDMTLNVAEEEVSKDDILELVVNRGFYKKDNGLYCGDRKIHYFRQFDETLTLMLFEGRHEQLVKYSLGFVKKNKRRMFQTGSVLVVGDSNAANNDKGEGWAELLQREVSLMKIHSTAVAGNTIGFDNNSENRLNTLSNITRYMDNAYEKNNKQPLNYIVIGLGTNDCKTIFKDSQTVVLSHFEDLILKIKSHSAYTIATQIVFVTPPPMASDDKLQAKYQGGDARIQSLITQLTPLSVKHQIRVFDAYQLLKPDFSNLFNDDGVHLNRKGKRLLASQIGIFLLNRN
jgi:lysophospholipase L1-like esterase